MTEVTPQDVRTYEQVAQGMPIWRDNLDRRHSPEALSAEERWRRVNKHTLGLYDWFRGVSQLNRIWQPVGGSILLKPDGTYTKDKIMWNQIRKLSKEIEDGGLDPKLGVIFQGLSDVEFYAADYANQVFEMLQSLPGGTGTNYARALFNDAWASEESNHARFWAMVVQAIGMLDADGIQARADIMHARGEFVVPPNSVFEMIAYVVAQELATEVTYKKVARILKGNHEAIRKDKDGNPQSVLYLPGNEDPELLKGTNLIKRDESAHFKFFSEILEIVMYYFPTETMEAILHVTDPANFVMPSAGSIPKDDYSRFNRVMLANGVLDRPILAAEVFDIVLKLMNIEDRTKWVKAMQAARQVPDPETGAIQDTALFTPQDITLQYDFARLSGKVNRKVDVVQDMYEAAGIDPREASIQRISGVYSDEQAAD
jgi:Fatty acid desaturase